MLVPMVEVGYVRMAVHERVVPVRVLMSRDRLVRMDVLVVGVIMDVLVVMLQGDVIVFVEMR